MTAPKAVSVVATFNPQGRMLWGRRKDNGKWTTPAGHVEPGESPREGAKRELHEEAGLLAGMTLQRLAQGKGGPDDSLDIHAFSAICTGTPTTENDPDDEVGEWKWIDVSHGLPRAMLAELHVPPAKNLLIKALPGLRPSTAPSAAEATLGLLRQRKEAA